MHAQNQLLVPYFDISNPVTMQQLQEMTFPELHGGCFEVGAKLVQ